MTTCMLRRAGSVLGGTLAALLVSSAGAEDVYVDAVNGLDSNGGTSWNDAWKTIGRAIYGAPGGVESTIYVAPGVYDAANGDSYPLPLPMWLEIIGVEGPEVTILDGGGSGYLFGTLDTAGSSSLPGARLSGLWLRNAQTGIDGFEDEGRSFALTLRNVFLSDFTGRAVFLNVYAQFTSTSVHAALENVRAWNCGTAVQVDAGSASPGGPSGDGTLVVRDSEFRDNAGRGIGSGGEGLEVVVERCRFTGNGDGFRSGSSSVLMSDSLLAGNVNGFVADGFADFYGVEATAAGLRRCTFADNTGFGVLIPFDVEPLGHVDLESCVVFGNSRDVRGLAGSYSGRFNNIGDGDLAGTNGNISADPLFVDAVARDYRLSFASPCVDAGDPATPPGFLDLSGRARPIDGDLDTLERPDMGAFEFAPLDFVGTPSLGATIELELWGPVGTARLLWARAPLAALPMPTPFGHLDLDRAKVNTFALTPTAPGPPAIVALALLSHPALVGSTFAFQALAPSTVSAPTMAFSNAVEFTVVQ